MNKKFLSLVLTAIIAFTFVVTTAVSAFAADPVLTVSKVNETDSTVTVAVGVSGNTGLSALGVNLAFDSTHLSYDKTDSTGIAAEAGMAAFGTDVGGNVRIVVEEGNSGDGTKDNGSVCVVTFKKLSTVKDGSTVNFTASSIPSLSYDTEGKDVDFADGSLSVSLKEIETATKKPAEKPVEKPDKPAEKPSEEKTTAKKPVTTKKPVVTTRPNVVSPTLPGVTVPTTVETTTEETTTEDFTIEEWTTEYESYSYTAPEQTDVDDDADDSTNTKRIIAIVVVVVCVGAAAVLYFTKKKDNKKDSKKTTDKK